MPLRAGSVDSGADFIAGNRTILATDFSRETLGAFPRIFELKSGNMEVASVKGKRCLRATSAGEFVVRLPEALPQRFTMEFELAGSGGWYQDILFSGDEDPYYVTLRPEEDGGISGPDGYRVISQHGLPPQEGVPQQVHIMADGSYVKVYISGKRVANAPNARIGRSKQIRFRLSADADSPALISNLCIAAGGKDLYRALQEDGRFTAEGILFDTDSSRIRPESESVLYELSAMLIAHGNLRVGIEGHTDSIGAAADNRTLSEKRATAVKEWLVTRGKIPAGRLEATGYGATNLRRRMKHPTASRPIDE